MKINVHIKLKESYDYVARYNTREIQIRIDILSITHHNFKIILYTGNIKYVNIYNFF
jgi:hypothetical protein